MRPHALKQGSIIALKVVLKHTVGGQRRRCSGEEALSQLESENWNHSLRKSIMRCPHRKQPVTEDL